MKQVRIYIALLCTLLLAAGCSKEMETETATTSPTDVASLIKIGDFPAFDQGADTRVIGTTDPGKTAWADGDKVLLKLQKNNRSGDYESHLCYTLTRNGTNWSSDTPINVVINDYDNINIGVIVAYYAPAYEWSEAAKQEPAGLPSLISGKQAGTDEFLTYTAKDVPMRDGISIDFSGTRPYSRLRVAAAVGATVQFTPSNGFFTPAGSSSALIDAAPLTATADANGNAFFYGKWTGSGEFNFFAAAPSKISEVKTTISNASIGGESYAVDATQLLPVASMSMTIDTSKNTADTSDATFILPIKDEAISGYRLFVDWGDGETSVFNAGSTPNQANRTHTYPQADEYTITISSTQTDALNKQMPIFDFSANESNSNRSKLTSLNTPLLNMGGTSFEGLFKNYTNLTTIPSGLFDNNTGVTIFKECFLRCTGLTAIPAGLFDKNTGVTTFESCFSGCTGLTAIPAGLFDNNTGVTTFASCFQGCTVLTTIPAGLFDRNTGVTTFESCFTECAGLTAIPAGLFEKNIKVTTFGYCFLRCTGLTAIPAGLFDKNTEVTTFEYCFSDCTVLTAIPEKLFDNNTKVTTFAGCFSYCTGLTAIPIGLFDSNTGVMNFEYCFRNCEGLTAIPEKLFDTNRAATKFKSCFENCGKVALNSNIFCDETDEKDKRFKEQTVDFTACFSWCGYKANENGTAPALWDYKNMTGFDSYNCFTGVTKVTNAGVIPDDWN